MSAEERQAHLSLREQTTPLGSVGESGDAVRGEEQPIQPQKRKGQ